MARIISVINFKGGVGKTTTAVNLAACLTRDAGLRVLLVDMDPQASATLHLWSIDAHSAEMEGASRTIAQLLFRAGKDLQYDIDRFLIPVRKEYRGRRLEGMHLLAGDNRLIKLDRGLGNRPTLLDSVLNPLRERFDVIIIDSPPVMYSVIQNNILASDLYLIPSVADHVSTSGIQHLLKILGSYFEKYRTIIRDRQARLAGVLFTRVGGLNVQLHRKLMQQVRDDFFRGAYAAYGVPAGSDPVFETTIRERIDVARAAAERVPLTLFDVNSDVSVDYLRLSRELATRFELAPAAPTGV